MVKGAAVAVMASLGVNARLESPQKCGVREWAIRSGRDSAK
jgi:hypothetical protein